MSLAYDRLGSGPPLVLLHGVGHRRQAWAAIADLVAPHRELLLVDLPGHGESPPLVTRGRPPVPVMLEAVLGLLAGPVCGPHLPRAALRAGTGAQLLAWVGPRRARHVSA